MKKVILCAAGLASAISIADVSAQSLIINGRVITGATIEDFNFSGNTLRLTTINQEVIGIIGSEPGDPDPGDPDPGDPDPGDPDPGPEDPNGGACSDTNVVCNYNISDSQWLSGVNQTRMTIPRGNTLASRFRTNSADRLAGTFGFQTVIGGATPQTRVWISEAPNGPVVSTCDATSSYIYGMQWTQFIHRNNCALELNRTYYINMKHVDANAPASEVLRSLTNNGRL